MRLPRMGHSLAVDKNLRRGCCTVIFGVVALYLLIGLAYGLVVVGRIRREEIKEFKETHDVGGMTDIQILEGLPDDSAERGLLIFVIAVEWPIMLAFFGAGYILTTAFGFLGRLTNKSTLRAARS